MTPRVFKEFLYHAEFKKKSKQTIAQTNGYSFLSHTHTVPKCVTNTCAHTDTQDCSLQGHKKCCTFEGNNLNTTGRMEETCLANIAQKVMTLVAKLPNDIFK